MMNMLNFVLAALMFAQGNAIPLEKRSTTAGEGNPTTITVSHAAATGGVSSSFTHVGGSQVSSSFFSVPTSVFTSVGGTPESHSTTAGEGNPKTVTVSHAAATGGVSSSFTHVGGSQVSSSFFSVPTSVFTSIGGTPESDSTTAGEGNPKTVTVSHAAATGGVSSSFTHVGGSSPSTTGITSIFTSIAGSSPSTISEPVPTTITIHNSPAAAALPTLNG